jgi:hypothetical protein
MPDMETLRRRFLYQIDYISDSPRVREYLAKMVSQFLDISKFDVEVKRLYELDMKENKLDNPDFKNVIG